MERSSKPAVEPVRRLITQKGKAFDAAAATPDPIHNEDTGSNARTSSLSPGMAQHISGTGAKTEHRMTTILIAVTGGSIAHTLRPLPIALRLRQLGAHVVFGGTGPFVKFLVEQGFPVVPLPMLDYARVCKMMDSENFHLYSVSEY